MMGWSLGFVVVVGNKDGDVFCGERGVGMTKKGGIAAGMG